MPARFFALIAFVTIVSTATATEPMSVQVQASAEKQTAEAIYKKAVLWVAEIPNDNGSGAIEYQNSETNTVVGNGRTDVKFGGWVKIQIPVRFKVRMEARSERYRITFTHIRVTLSGVERAIEEANRAELEKVVRPKLEELAASFAARLKSADADNW